MVYISQLKGRDCQIRFKKQDLILCSYKKCTSSIKTHTGKKKIKDWKMLTQIKRKQLSEQRTLVGIQNVSLYLRGQFIRRHIIT